MSDTPKLDAEQIRAEARGYSEELAEWRRERAALQAELDLLKRDNLLLRDERDAEAESRNDLQIERDALRKFAQIMMSYWPCGDVDGGDLQAAAVEGGLLIPEIKREPCGEPCNCAVMCADFPCECYRKTPLLTGDRAMEGVSKE